MVLDGELLTSLFQVAEDFIDISTPLKHLSEAAVVPVGQC